MEDNASGGSLEAFEQAWLGALDGESRRLVADTLSRVEGDLREAWAGTPPLLEDFWAELARCLPTDGAHDSHDSRCAEELVKALANLHVVDLHLAFASRMGDASALAHLEQRHIATLRPVIARIDRRDAFIDEIQQRLRTKLLIEDGSPAKLAHYTGRGPLATWLKVVAAREALDSVRADRRRALDSDDALFAIEAQATGPEMLVLKQQYKAQFAEAFRDALGELRPAERNALRLHYVHGLSIDKLGAVLRIHRSSAARRVIKARKALLAGTRRLLHARLSISRMEFDDLMGLIASRIDLSIERYLGQDD